jgi:hypothetical protein
MDTNELIAHSRARFDHHQARQVLREKYQAKLNFAHGGGMFCATPEMITFLSLYHDEQIVVKDLYDSPVRVTASELCALMKARWQEQMNAWLADYEQLGQNR